MIDDQWLKETFKDTSTEELQSELDQLQSFGGSPGMIGAIQSELERRERENNGK